VISDCNGGHECQQWSLERSMTSSMQYSAFAPVSLAIRA
jgi:hypothetical protein